MIFITVQNVDFLKFFDFEACDVDKEHEGIMGGGCRGRGVEVGE